MCLYVAEYSLVYFLVAASMNNDYIYDLPQTNKVSNVNGAGQTSIPSNTSQGNQVPGSGAISLKEGVEADLSVGGQGAAPLEVGQQIHSGEP